MEQSIKCLKKKWKNAIAVHLPIHARWLNQIEIYFAIVRKKVLTPNDFPNFETVEERLMNFQIRFQKVVYPFSWKFTRTDLIPMKILIHMVLFLVT